MPESTIDSQLLRVVVATPGVGKRKHVFVRQYIELNGLRRHDVQYVVHNNSLINIVRALVERVYFVEGPTGDLVQPPLPTRAVFNNRMSDFKQQLLANIQPVQRMCLRTFVRTSPKHKLKVYQQAMQCYLKTGLTERDANVTSFIKAEKVSAKKQDPAPRIIQPRGVKFNLVYGCFIRPAEKAIYQAIDKVYGSPTVVCGHNASQQAEMLFNAWTSIADPVAISYDLSRMDQHVSEVALRWEHGIYREMFRDDPCLPTLEWCLSKTVANIGVAYTVDKFGQPYRVNYKKRGSRMSGDMNTSCGNKVLMCAMLFSYFTSYLGFVVGVDYAVVDNGDDCVVILSRAAYIRMLAMTTQREHLVALFDPARWDIVHIRAVVGAINPATHEPIDVFFRSLGFTLKEEGLVYEFEKIEFCQTQPCLIDGRWLMVRTLSALSKDCYCLKHWNQFEEWLSQVATAGCNVYGNVPIFSAFYAAMSDRKANSLHLLEQSGLYYLSAGMESSGVVTDENRVSFYNTFGVTPGEQVLIEQHYRNMKRGEVQQTSFGQVLPM